MDAESRKSATQGDALVSNAFSDVMCASFAPNSTPFAAACSTLETRMSERLASTEGTAASTPCPSGETIAATDRHDESERADERDWGGDAPGLKKRKKR